jgi:hypothetical protein
MTESPLRRTTGTVLADARGAGGGTFAILAGQALTLAASGIFVTVVANAVALGEGSTDASQTEDAANGRGRDGFEGLAARGRGCKGFGQVIKAIRIHLSFFLPQ